MNIRGYIFCALCAVVALFGAFRPAPGEAQANAANQNLHFGLLQSTPMCASLLGSHALPLMQNVRVVSVIWTNRPCDSSNGIQVLVFYQQ